MAARHLQRLRAAQVENLDEESSSEEEIVAQRAPFNPFDLLSDEEVNPLKPPKLQFHLPVAPYNHFQDRCLPI